VKEEWDGMKYIKSQEWLVEHLTDANVRVVDCRFTLGKPQAGWEAYQNNHIPGAVFFDLEDDLSGELSEHGGEASSS